MAGLFVVDFGGDDGFAQRQADERRRLRARYLQRLVDAVPLEQDVAERVMAVLFEHVTADGRECSCSCHPGLSAQHGDGFDCPCTWDPDRRAAQRAAWLEALRGPELAGLRDAHAREETDVATWLAGQVGVTATRTSSYAPEQWEGEIDGHSFYFRERHGSWRLELDLEPTGRFANRFVAVADDGGMVTEPVPLTEGEVIARGEDHELGEHPVDHLDFIVRTVRRHLWARVCDHAGALFFCPKCGAEMTGPPTQ